MDLSTLAWLTAASQFAQATSAFLGKISPPPTNPWAAAAVAVGKQLATNAANVLAQGVTAAQNEFALSNKDDKQVAGTLANLPPIS